MLINVKVVPLSKNPRMMIIESNQYYSIKAYLKSAPAKGTANKELVDTLSQLFKVSKNEIQIKKGLTSSSKILSIPFEKHDLKPFITHEDISLL